MKRLALLVPLVLFTACQQTSIRGVTTFDYTGGEHQDGKITYREALPVGGPHNPAWQNCGEYQAELYPEYAVHSLEHGAVWVTYRPTLDQESIQTLRSALNGRTHTLLSPRSTQTSPIVLTAWNAQLNVEKASDPRVGKFIQKYEQGGTAPEIGASCSGAYDQTQ
ncbi:hypothetical protein HNQ07_004039 [Deinococcus metalli]|uniref:DUF3105 domain-containing protein n=1 Tax=Deinococcus metalli TaxID=1141878 RepID=A0A7W8NTT0_9DEIO|nr:DUF3105 domain-containing protein [Deinococcus metalli]MBB5378532.1 hypothetical protein [Deinococcus metalli]GHF58381.1 hypothetical protein GCM10017781_38330 [Deinococcus metalli]